MIALGILIGAVLAAPVFFVLGACSARDRRTNVADIRPALRRSLR